MKDSLESRVIAAKLAAEGSDEFVRRTMTAIRTKGTRATFTKVLHSTKPKPGIRFVTWLQHLPTAAVIALILLTSIATSGVAYAAYRWLAPKITILHENPSNDDRKHEYSVNIENCGVTVGGTPIGNGVQKFEVVKGSTLTKAQVEKVLQQTCKYQKLIEYSNEHLKGSGYGSIKKGDLVTVYGPFEQNKHDMGTITALSESSITIVTTVYGEIPDTLDVTVPTAYYPEGKVVASTYSLAENLEYIQDGAPIKADEVQVGDVVNLFVRGQKIAQYENDLDMINVEIEEEVVGMVKTDLDLRYVQSPFFGDLGIVGQIFQLVGCQGSEDYLCLSVNSPSGGEYIYADNSRVEGIPADREVEDATKYFRKDIPENPTGYAHTVQGRIQKLDDKYMTLYSRGEVHKIEIELPYDVIGSHNKKHTVQVKEGDFIQIDYMQKKREDQTRIRPADTYRIMLMQYQLPDGSYKNY